MARSRTTLRPGGLLGLACVLALLAAGWASPLTAITKVRVEGGGPDEREAVEKAVARLRGVPCAQVDPRRVEAEVLGLPWLASAELDRTPFGSAVLRLKKREMVARLFGSSDVGLARDGTICRSPGLSPQLPLLKTPPLRPGFGLVGEWPVEALVTLANEGPALAAGKDVRIDLDTGGGLCLNIGTGRVVLGSPEELETKLGILRQRMVDRPDELSSVAELNLVQPSNPVLIPRPDPDRLPTDAPPPTP